MLTGQLLDTFIRAELFRRAHDPMQVTGATGTTGGGHRDTPDRR